MIDHGGDDADRAVAIEVWAKPVSGSFQACCPTPRTVRLEGAAAGIQHRVLIAPAASGDLTAAAVASARSARTGTGLVTVEGAIPETTRRPIEM